jgi:hypothetical protein
VSRSAAPGEDLDRWLTPFLDAMGRRTRRRWGPLYVRGLLGPDGPKSVQPIAARLGLRGHDRCEPYRVSWRLRSLKDGIMEKRKTSVRYSPEVRAVVRRVLARRRPRLAVGGDRLDYRRTAVRLGPSSVSRSRMACSPNQIEDCPDLPPRPPLRRIGVACCFLSGCPLSDFGDDDYAVRIGGCTMRAIDL